MSPTVTFRLLLLLQSSAACAVPQVKGRRLPGRLNDQKASVRATSAGHSRPVHGELLISRKSAISTANTGQDPTMQTRELEEYCQRRGWELAGVYV